MKFLAVKGKGDQNEQVLFCSMAVRNTTSEPQGKPFRLDPKTAMQVPAPSVAKAAN